MFWPVCNDQADHENKKIKKKQENIHNFLFCDQPRDGYILAETCSLLYLINKLTFGQNSL
jgi:hypothetical protein